MTPEQMQGALVSLKEDLANQKIMTDYFKCLYEGAVDQVNHFLGISNGVDKVRVQGLCKESDKELLPQGEGRHNL